MAIWANDRNEVADVKFVASESERGENRWMKKMDKKIKGKGKK